eukprot:12164561-Heterocapsa_arctica.AAC.1
MRCDVSHAVQKVLVHASVEALGVETLHWVSGLLEGDLPQISRVNPQWSGRRDQSVAPLHGYADPPDVDHVVAQVPPGVVQVAPAVCCVRGVVTAAARRRCRRGPPTGRLASRVSTDRAARCALQRGHGRVKRPR